MMLFSYSIDHKLMHNALLFFSKITMNYKKRKWSCSLNKRSELFNLVVSAYFRYKRKANKRPWNTIYKHVVKICPNRGHIFQNKLRNMWTWYWKYLQSCHYLNWHLVCKVKDKSKIQTYEQKVISQHKFLWASSNNHVSLVWIG